MTTTLRLGVFTPSVLLDIARSEGRLRAADLEVIETLVASSPAQFTALDAGEYDAVFTSPDNVIAYSFVPANPLGRILDIEIVQVVDRGLGLSLALRPGLDAVTPGLRFAVDVPQSGFAFVGYALLERAGLARDDYELVSLGSTPRRTAALLAGECDATILGAGNELTAATGGARIISDVTSLGPYLGTVLVRRCGGSPVGTSVDALAAVLRDTAAAVVAGDLDDVAAFSAERVLGLDAQAARAHVAVLRSPDAGLYLDEGVDEAAFATLLELRRRYLPDPALDRVSLSAILA